MFNDTGVLVITAGLPWNAFHSTAATDKTPANVFECRSGMDDGVSWLHSLGRHTCCVPEIAVLHYPPYAVDNAFSFTEISGFRSGLYGDRDNSGEAFTLIDCVGEIGNFGNWAVDNDLSNVGGTDSPVAAPVLSAAPTPGPTLVGETHPPSASLPTGSPTPVSAPPTSAPSPCTHRGARLYVHNFELFGPLFWTVLAPVSAPCRPATHVLCGSPPHSVAMLIGCWVAACLKPDGCARFASSGPVVRP